MKAELKALVFDLDGVIIDSELLHYQAILEAMGKGASLVTYETYLAECTGGDERFAMGKMANLSGVEFDEQLFVQWSERKALSYASLVEENLRPMPGAVELVESVAEKLPVGLATGSAPSDVEVVLRTLAGGRLKSIFQTVVTAGDVLNPKPDPSTYSKAVEQLGCRPSDCLAIEDSPKGITSALGAGLRVVGIAFTHPEDKLSKADWIVPSLSELSVENLFDWFCENSSFRQ